MTPEIETLCDQIAETLKRGIDEDAVKAWIYAELLEDAGLIAVYHQTSDGLIHAHSCRSGTRVEGVLLSQIAELRRQWATTVGRAWTVASHSWEHPKLSIQFGYDDVTDLRGASVRRDRWEKQQFGERGVEPRDR